MIQIVLHNNERTNAVDLYVSIQDNNQAGAPVILQNHRINVDATYQLEVQEDQNNSGNINWTATSTEDSSKSLQGGPVTVSSGDTVEVTSW